MHRMHTTLTLDDGARYVLYSTGADFARFPKLRRVNPCAR